MSEHDEFEGLFSDEPELRRLAGRTRHSMAPVQVDPDFRRRLRAQLMTEAPRALRGRWWQRRGGTLPALIAGGGGLALVAASLLLVMLPSRDNLNSPVATISVANQANVSPDQVITVSFDQPMNKAVVVAGLHIEPATAVSTTWQGNTLVVTPVHQLTPNTAYSVTINQAAVVTATGTHAAQAVSFSFGTAPTPTPIAAPSPGSIALNGQLIAQFSNPVVAGFDGNGSAVITGSLVSSPQSSASPAASGAATYVVTTHSVAQLFDHSVASVAASPDGTQLVSATVSGGSSSIDVSNNDGSAAHHLADLTAPVIALVWTSGDIDAVTAGHIVAISLDGKVTTLASAPAGQTFESVSQSGDFALAAAGADSSLIDLISGADTVLNGAAIATWSGDGSTLAWRSASTTVAVATTSGIDTPHTIDSGGATVAQIALNHDGSEAALLLADGSLALYDTQTGALLATAGRPATVTSTASPSAAASPSPSATPSTTASLTALAFSTDGNQLLALAQDGSIYAYTPPASSSDTVIPTAVTELVSAYISAQVKGEGSAAASLAPSVSPSLSAHVNRGSLLDIAPSNDGSGFVAHARLVSIPGAGSTAVKDAIETLTIAGSASSGWSITSALVQPFADVTAGPHIVRAAQGRNARVITLAFDSDLAAATVLKSIDVTHDGSAVPIAVRYSASSKTITVTVLEPVGRGFDLHISTGLTDISGQALAAPYKLALSR